MAVPFSFAGVFNLPGDPTLPAAPIPFNVSSQYGSESKEVLTIASAGTIEVSFGTVGAPGAKLIAIKVDPSSTGAPINVRVNEAMVGDIEVCPGGFIVIANPVPVAGITAVSIVSTTANKVTVWALA